MNRARDAGRAMTIGGKPAGCEDGVHMLETAIDEHVYFSKEAATGGRGIGGGGCGCN